MAEKAILYDPTRCTACRGCQAACKQWNENDEIIPDVENGVQSFNRGSYENPPDLSPQTWLKMEFREVERDGKCTVLMPVVSRSVPPMPCITMNLVSSPIIRIFAAVVAIV